MEESDSSEWNKFKEVSTKKKKYRCQCGKVYNTAGSLTTHVKMQHGGVVKVTLSRDQCLKRSRRNLSGVDPNSINTNSSKCLNSKGLIL